MRAASRSPGSARSSGAAALTDIGTGASNTDTLDKTYQINEKLTWLKGRHSLKFGGQLLHYVQRRFYAGNNGLLGLFGYGGTFTGFAFSDFLLDQVTNKGRGSVSAPWTHLHNRIALYVQDDFKVTFRRSRSTSGMRWAYTQPVVEKDNRQSNFDLTTGQQIFAQDGSIARVARSTSPTRRASSRGSASPGGSNDRWVLRGGYGISQYMEGTGANLRLPLNPPFFFESDVRYDATTGGGTLAHRLRGREAARSAFGPGARVGSEPAAAVHAAVERLRRVPAHRRRCRRTSGTSATTRRTW